MATALYFHSVNSKAVFNSRYETENAQPFTQLQHPSASSKWGRKELFACRVLPRVRDKLPLLRNFIEEHDQFGPEILQFIQGPEANQLAWSELALVRRHGHSLGQVWAALAMFRGPPDRRLDTKPAVVGSDQDQIGDQDESEAGGDNDDEAGGDNDDQESSGRAKRIRRNTQQEGFCDSGTMRVESSSPFKGSNRSSSIGYIDPDSQAPWRPEDDTLHFIRCTLRHVLYFASTHSDTRIVIEVRDAKVRLSTVTNIGNRRLVAVDDGGLCLREQMADGGYATQQNRVMMLEAKGELQCIRNGCPIISDECLAQMTCQALTARLCDPQGELKDGW